MADKPKLTTGTNDRPKHETIAQTGQGLPDDSSNPVDASAEQIARQAVLGRRFAQDAQKRSGDKGLAKQLRVTITLHTTPSRPPEFRPWVGRMVIG